MEKKSNGFIRFIKGIGIFIRNIFFYIIYYVAYIFVFPFVCSKVVGKKKIKKTDEARVFVVNHYELIGPATMYMSFPYRFKPWIIDKMMDEKLVKQQMGLMVYNNYKGVPMFFKKAAVHTLGSLTSFVMRHAGGIAVSRENLRANIKTFEISSKYLEKGKNLAIWPELYYVKEGVGKFQNGIEHFAKYYYKKTNKKITFYPIFVSKQLRTIFVSDGIIYNPNSETPSEIVDMLRDEMVKTYQEVELKNAKLQQKLEKKRKKSEIKAQKSLQKKNKRADKNLTK